MLVHSDRPNNNVHVLNAQRVYVQLFSAWDYCAKNYYYLRCACTSVDSLESSDTTNKNKWKLYLLFYAIDSRH